MTNNNAYVSGASTVNLINGVRKEYKAALNTQINNACPQIVQLMKFNASAETKTYTIPSAYADYDTIFLVGSDQATASTPMFLTISTKNIPYGGYIRVEAPAVTYTTRFNITRGTAGDITITAALCYNQSQAQQSTTGYIKGVYVMKIGD